jgi:hypothetical protein
MQTGAAGFSLGSSADNLPHSTALGNVLDLQGVPHPSFFYQSPFLPRSATNQPHCRNDQKFDLFGVNKYLNTLELLVLVVSNNFGQSQMDSLLE